MKRFTVSDESGLSEEVLSLTPERAANCAIGFWKLRKFQPRGSLTVIAEDGHTSLVKVGSDG